MTGVPDAGVIMDLWGNEQPLFVTAKERYGVWPITVWDVDHSDAYTRELKTQIGDAGYRTEKQSAGHSVSAREGAFGGSGLYDITASVFSPAVTTWALNCFAPARPCRIYDPFGGGGTRAIMAAAAGHTYWGTELRPQEVAAVDERLYRLGLNTKAKLSQGDSSQPQPIPSQWGDFLITCPPYYNLETYGGGDGDLSMAATYDEFLVGYRAVIEQSKRIMQKGANCVWVTGLLRNNVGDLTPLPQDTARIHLELGFGFKEEVILSQKNNGALQRVREL